MREDAEGLAFIFLIGFVVLALARVIPAALSLCPVDIGDPVFDPESQKHAKVIGIEGGGSWTKNCRVVVRYTDNTTGKPREAYYFERRGE